MEMLQRGETPSRELIDERRTKATRAARQEARKGNVTHRADRAEFLTPEAETRAHKRAQRALRAAQRVDGDPLVAPSHILEKLRLAQKAGALVAGP